MKKFIILFIMSIILISPIITIGNLSYAIDGEAQENYVIYDEENEIICERSSIELGDIFITPDFVEYEIVSIENHKGYAIRKRQLDRPNIKKDEFIRKEKEAERGALEKKICLYMTHNDESYRPSDGYDSIYGAGGIHDVARKFKDELSRKGINVVLNEDLHIPHDSGAYNRSGETAKTLLRDERPDAMFDVHRDGVSRSYYYVANDRGEFSKIRIVIGKSNPNFEENYKFAQSLFVLGNSKYPSLFSDIYIGKGHYNQSLQPTDLLFEMGTYLIEKDLVYNTLPLLADVVDIAMYGSKIDEEGDIIVDNDIKLPNDEDNAVVVPGKDNSQNSTDISNSTSKKNNGWIYPMLMTIILVIGLIGFGAFLIKNDKNKKSK